jgi:hypothetical protein
MQKVPDAAADLEVRTLLHVPARRSHALHVLLRASRPGNPECGLGEQGAVIVKPPTREAWIQCVTGKSPSFSAPLCENTAEESKL